MNGVARGILLGRLTEAAMTKARAIVFVRQASLITAIIANLIVIFGAF